MNLTKITASILIVTVVTAGIISCKKDNNPTPPVTPPSNLHLDSGLLVYLPFDGNFADSSGNGNTVTALNGASLTYDEHGYTARAFGGTGNGEKLVVTNNGSIKYDTTYTLSYDFMCRAPGRQSFISMVQESTGHSASFISGINIPNSPYFAFAALDNSEGCGTFSVDGPTVANDTTPLIPQPESWYNAICIYRKGTVKVYINGSLISSQTSTGTSASLCSIAQLVVGGWWSQDNISINGKLDEVRLYNRVLNADEIAELSKEFNH